MSSATIMSIAPTCSCLASSAAFKLARKPVTTTSSIDSAPVGVSASIVDAFCARALVANPTSAVAMARDTARPISVFLPTGLIELDMLRPSWWRPR